MELPWVPFCGPNFWGERGGGAGDFRGGGGGGKKCAVAARSRRGGGGPPAWICQKNLKGCRPKGGLVRLGGEEGRKGEWEEAVGFMEEKRGKEKKKKMTFGEEVAVQDNGKYGVQEGEKTPRCGRGGKIQSPWGGEAEKSLIPRT